MREEIRLSVSPEARRALGNRVYGTAIREVFAEATDLGWLPRLAPGRAALEDCVRALLGALAAAEDAIAAQALAYTDEEHRGLLNWIEEGGVDRLSYDAELGQFLARPRAICSILPSTHPALTTGGHHGDP